MGKEYLNVVQPAFLVSNKSEEDYGAYKIERLDKLEKVNVNNVEQLRLVLNKIARIQAQCLMGHELSCENREYLLKPIAKSITGNFTDIEEQIITTTLDGLQTALNKLLQSNLLVLSNWMSTNNIYIDTNNNDVVFLQNSPGQLLPPAHDALLCIFSLTTEKFRQHHYEDLANFYFKSLINAFKNSNQTIADNITEAYIETQTNTFLPVVKLTAASKAKGSDELRDILANIENYLKFPEVNQEDVYHAIKTKLASSEFDLLNYSLRRLTENNGHLGDYFHLEITVKHQEIVEIFKLFAKIVNSTTDAFTDLIENGLGKKEKFFYITLCGLFDEHGLNDLMDFAPKCYMSGLKGMILDDLTSIGYTPLTPDISLKFDGVRIILEKLAKFHACTFIIEELLSRKWGRKVRLGEEYSGYLEEALIVTDGSIGDFMFNRFQSIFILLDKVPELTKEVDLTREEIHTRLTNVRQSLFRKVRTSKTIRNVINHGDMYVSNMLFKFGDEQSVLDGMLVDFQILRYMPPAYEVQFFINVCSSKEDKDKYQELLLNEYYDNMSAHLKKFDINPEEIYSRENYEIDLQNTKSAAMLMTFCYLVVLCADPEFREEMMRVEETMKFYLEYHQEKYLDIALKWENYRNRVTGIVRDLLECL
ncbi:uncharacterized protein LOC109535823 [Dendroctonus ponderosae]|uniref:uncharacterized protein LOC109535823 n=1 Tax=Dendroctonus ponderosae TaxID=77166 RepID=UPI002034E18A|nr:uncharacterized protein LOC109535823 [Dendroctonus ponderosae]